VNDGLHINTNTVTVQLKHDNEFVLQLMETVKYGCRGDSSLFTVQQGRPGGDNTLGTSDWNWPESNNLLSGSRCHIWNTQTHT